MSPPPTPTPTRPGTRRVRISEVSEWGTELVVDTASATPERQAVASLPDPVLADRVVRSVDRVLWQRLAADGSHATVAGVRRRRPVYLRVSSRAALGLLDAGVPTIVDGSERP